MERERVLQCDECQMNFRTSSQLKRHNEKFCIGVSDPFEKQNDLQKLQRPNPHDSIDFVAQDRIKELEALKERKLRQQEIDDSEEKQLLTDLRRNSKLGVNLTRKRQDHQHIQDQINKVRNRNVCLCNSIYL